MKKKSKVTVIVPLFLLILLIMVASFAIYIKTLTLPTGQDLGEEGVKVEVTKGESVKKLAEVLEDKKIVRSANLLYLMARYKIVRRLIARKEGEFFLKSGVYHFDTSMDIAEVFSVLQEDKEAFIKVVVPEGLTISKIASKLEEEGVCGKEEFIKECHSEKTVSKYNIANNSLEGYLFPDTYYFIPSMEVGEVIDKMVSNFAARVNNILMEYEEDADISSSNREGEKDEQDLSGLNDLVILASIIEKEYKIAREAPIISSVFHNRLKDNIGLYSCATVEYIITEIEGLPHPTVITYSDLQKDSPYNTYKWRGLPPSAISNPGEVALKAALMPAKTNYYFFRLVNKESGEHYFSSTFNKHIKEGELLTTK